MFFAVFADLCVFARTPLRTRIVQKLVSRKVAKRSAKTAKNTKPHSFLPRLVAGLSVTQTKFAASSVLPLPL
jgi:hypothetical protein